ncbi:MAG: coproporphyrinogen-III oxidase family protein [Opitutales bacterium]
MPFCASTCDFCGFYQQRPRSGDVDAYLDALEREWAAYPDDLPVDTVFWGGGTPGLLGAREIDRLAGGLRRRLAAEPVEWTVEMTPATVRPEKVKALRDNGVTRISMGLQSFQPRLLEALGRQHTVGQIDKAWKALEAVGFPTVNGDLIFGIPGQTAADLEADLQALIALDPDHISTYCLTFEEDTALYLRLSEGKVSRDPDAEAEAYSRVWDTLQAAGYHHYEISNFARHREGAFTGGDQLPDRASRHNVIIWSMGEWIGLGPAAASQWQGERWTNRPDLVTWLALAGTDRQPDLREDRTALTPDLLAADSLIFGLRMTRGVDLSAWRNRFPAAAGHAGFDPLLARLEADGLAERDGPWLHLTRSGLMVADHVGMEILACFDPPGVLPDRAAHPLAADSPGYG